MTAGVRGQRRIVSSRGPNHVVFSSNVAWAYL